MVRYWVIAPYHYDIPEAFEQVWRYDRNNGVISIGWNMGDVRAMTRQEMISRYTELYPHALRSVHQVIKFWYDIQPGDRIIARGGRKRILGVGTVQGIAYYSQAKGQEMAGNMDIEPYESFLPVQWDDLVEKEFSRLVFGMLTVYELPGGQGRFEELTGGITELDREKDELSELALEETRILRSDQEYRVQTEFVLEKYLEEFIVSNFKAVFGEGVELHRDEEGGDGRQYSTDIGIIDILAWEPATNSYVVVELKKGKTSDAVVGQTLRYMGWVKEHLCQQGEAVRGIIICRDLDERLEYALSVVNNVEVRFYRVDFQLSAHPHA